MMTAHVGPDDHGPVPPGGFSQLADGRPAALFVVLAGVSLALLSGGAAPVVGTRLVQARVRILVRALLLFALGELLILLATPVVVILPTYGLLFAIGLRRAALVPGGAAHRGGGRRRRRARRSARRIAARLEGARPTVLAEITVGHYYPAIVWTAYLLVGLAVGRSDLRSTRLRGARRARRRRPRGPRARRLVGRAARARLARGAGDGRAALVDHVRGGRQRRRRAARLAGVPRGRRPVAARRSPRSRPSGRWRSPRTPCTSS